MPQYEIPCDWRMYGTYHIEADSLEEAVEKSFDLPFPDHQEYLSDTYRPDIVSLVESVVQELTEADKEYLQKQYVAKSWQD